MSATRSVLGTVAANLVMGLINVDMRQVLQRTHLVLGQRALAADVQNRTFGAECGGDSGNRVRAARTGGRDDAAELARLPGIAVGRVRRHLLMPHVDDANALVDAAIIDVDDVPAAQGEYRVDSLVLQSLGDQVAAGDDARIAALALQSIFGGRGLGLNRRGIYGCHASSNCMSNQLRTFARHQDDTGADVGAVSKVFAKCRMRMGLSTNTASTAATTLNVIAIANTADQPCAFEMSAAYGTSSAPVPLAVYSMPLLAAANFEPKVSPAVAGNRLKISPYTPK